MRQYPCVDIFESVYSTSHMKALKDYLRVAGISQAELAKRADINAAALNHFICGRREPRLANLRKISQATGISIEKLVQGL
jgi:transcriptional regulator with XRE-family HTH domain